MVPRWNDKVGELQLAISGVYSEYPYIVLRIFGIYTHAQLDRRFWDCMSRQLERKGAEYRKRFVSRASQMNGVANNWR